MLVKQHALELAPHQITVNGVAPTFVYTEMIRHVMERPDFRAELERRIPLGRIAIRRMWSGPFYSLPLPLLTSLLARFFMSTAELPPASDS